MYLQRCCIDSKYAFRISVVYGSQFIQLLLNTYVQREEEFLSSWWQEYAECSEGPRAPSNSNSKLDSQKKASSLDRAQSAKLYEIEEERVGVPVKGGLYEVAFLSFS